MKPSKKAAVLRQRLFDWSNACRYDNESVFHILTETLRDRTFPRHFFQ